MNTWLVGHVPIGMHQMNYPKARPAKDLNELGAKTFFMKARIMAGQVNLKENKFGLQDFKWLHREELREEVDGSYWKSIKNMLADR
jgi:large subunit ribosomal protein L46